MTKEKVLLAEDHPSMRAMLAKFLLREFDLVASVESGAAVLDSAGVADVIVIDVRMPVIDGIEVVRQLKNQGCEAKIVFVSVSESASQVAACFAAGGDAYVSKLRMATDLIAAVRQVLAGEKFISPIERGSTRIEATAGSKADLSIANFNLLNGNGRA